MVREQVIVDALGGDEHKREVHRVLFGANVLRRLGDAHLEVIHKCLLGSRALGTPHLRTHETIVVIKREFGVNRDDFIVHEDGGIYYLAVLERVLDLVHTGREYVLEHGLQVILAQDAALLWVLQQVLERLKLFGKALGLPADFLHRGHFLRNLFNEPRGLRELPVSMLLHLL